KRRLIDELPDGGPVILDVKDAVVGSWARELGAAVVAPLCDTIIPTLGVAGRHQRANAALAGAAALAFGCPQSALVEGLKRFRGLPHRLQTVAEIQGRRFINDSKSTTPAATIAALKACGDDVWLLAGGLSKDADDSMLPEAVVARARGVAYFGDSRGDLFAATRRVAAEFESEYFATLDEALAWCWHRSRRGDTILLSPACASFDQYRGFEHRGEHFVELVNDLARRCAS
ncbi:MAG TPA: cyanophycin synthetase, partial [Pirellulales bacterium]|nr:cyanophycin synthetase [Pirellulales bacterium]